ncbi:unnamed protein product, partial [Mesorhabditis belari]|uniref:Uncharacterized protein n=1 Tax=Mesorhabditis belari TaxID=2138241 RepID=A0AAF3EA99_9BILA
METIRRFQSSCYDFGRSVVEWRSPLTAPYLMLINSAFWATSLYADRMTQLQALLSFSAFVFGWDVLLSPTHERNIATHMLFWPVQSLWRTFGVSLNLYSAHVLRVGLAERAFCSAYCALACLLINPVWNYYDTNQKIANTITYSGKQVYAFLQKAVIQPFLVVARAIKYVVCFQFVPPMLAAIRQAFSSTGGGIKGLWMAFYSWICAGLVAIAKWWRTCVLTPIGNGFRKLGQFLRYWLCAHWWPDFCAWMKLKFGRPLQRLFNYVCFCLVYVVCGHWIRPVSRFVWKYLCVLGGFLHRNVLTPMKIKLLEWGHEVSVLTKRLLHQAALAIRDSVIWPICLAIVDAGKQVYAVIYRTFIQPVIDYFYVRYKKIEDVAYIYVLGPVCEKVIKNIPEKSPFCDDSDEELEGLLPEEFSGDEEEIVTPATPAVAPVAQEPPLRPSVSQTIRKPVELPIQTQKPVEVQKPVTPKKEKQNEVPEEEDLLPDLEFENDDDDHEFAIGLSFPAIHASESSDEEFDLNKGAPRVRRPKKPKVLRVKEEEHVIEEEELVPKRRSQKPRAVLTQSEPISQPQKPINPDDHFELLG